MENLKIKVNSESEAEDAKHLAVKAGYTLDDLFGRKWSAEFCYLLLCKDMSAGFGNEIMADGDKTLPIGELRAMVHPINEYLEPLPNGEYKYHRNLSLVGGDWIKIPEGAIRARFYPNDPDALEFEGDFCQWWHDKDNEWINYENYSNTLEHSRVVWQRDQDEPFLTPETTLNDQYAEIEEVRQAIREEAQAASGIDATLAERQSQYGCYEDVAHVTQEILKALRVGGYDRMPAPHKEAMHMIASKMARIVNGDFNHLDSWHDIGGYSKLIEKLIKGE